MVDDDRALRTLICRSLTKHGFEALEAIDAESALVLFHANQSRIALVISDMVMPGMDGPALMRELLHTWPDLNVLFITGYCSKYRAAISGFPCLPKPFLMAELVERAEALLPRLRPTPRLRPG